MYVQHDRCEEGISWSLCTPRWPKLSVGSLPRASAIPTARNCKYPKKSSNLKRENHGKYFRTLYGPWTEIQNKNWKRWPRLSVRRESFSRCKIYWFSCKIWSQYICDLISIGLSFWHSCQHNNALLQDAMLWLQEFAESQMCNKLLCIIVSLEFAFVPNTGRTILGENEQKTEHLPDC